MVASKEKNAALDVVAWLSNVLTTIMIIFLTKWLMTAYNFQFATTICGLHFLACAAAIRGASAVGYIEHIAIPFKHVLLFSLIGSVSIASANFSLLLNTVGFYQIAKLLLAPFVCVVESVYFGKRFSINVILSIFAVLVGVGIVTVSDVESNLLGVIMAVIFIVSSGIQQILCGHFQTKFNIASFQLLANTSPVQGTILLLIGPHMDLLVTSKWIGLWEPNAPALEVLMASCIVAVGVNLSQFLCLGRFSATSFQVLGHAKTILVLFGGWALFNETINVRQLSGMSLAVAGMISYGYFMSKGGVRNALPPAPLPEPVKSLPRRVYSGGELTKP